jgi:hypothetical protein
MSVLLISIDDNNYLNNLIKKMKILIILLLLSTISTRKLVLTDNLNSGKTMSFSDPSTLVLKDPATNFERTLEDYLTEKSLGGIRFLQTGEYYKITTDYSNNGNSVGSFVITTKLTRFAIFYLNEIKIRESASFADCPPIIRETKNDNFFWINDESFGFVFSEQNKVLPGVGGRESKIEWKGVQRWRYTFVIASLQELRATKNEDGKYRLRFNVGVFINVNDFVLGKRYRAYLISLRKNVYLSSRIDNPRLNIRFFKKKIKQ